MKSILIPPIPNLDISQGRPFHLLLSHLAENPDYAEFYKAERRAGSYLILDNGAHEFQSGEGPSRLLDLAEDLKVQELVVPDYLFDADQTVEKAKKALEWFSTVGRERFALLDPRLMIVPQGNSFYSWKRCLHHLTEVFYEFQARDPSTFWRTPVIGVSKDYEEFPGGLPRLLDKVIIPHAISMNSPIHMLGWGRKLWDLKIVAKEFGSFIRTVDSAKPFVYAMSDIRLESESDQVPPYPLRPKDYFSRGLRSIGEVTLACQNVDIFDRVASWGG